MHNYTSMRNHSGRKGPTEYVHDATQSLISTATCKAHSGTNRQWRWVAWAFPNDAELERKDVLYWHYVQWYSGRRWLCRRYQCKWEYCWTQLICDGHFPSWTWFGKTTIHALDTQRYIEKMDRRRICNMAQTSICCLAPPWCTPNLHTGFPTARFGGSQGACYSTRFAKCPTSSCLCCGDHDGHHCSSSMALPATH